MLQSFHLLCAFLFIHGLLAHGSVDEGDLSTYPFRDPSDELGVVSPLDTRTINAVDEAWTSNASLTTMVMYPLEEPSEQSGLNLKNDFAMEAHAKTTNSKTVFLAGRGALDHGETE